MIEVKNLEFKYYSSGKILSNISFSIKESEFVLILGPSASGKTTLGYCLSGIIPHIIDGELKGNVLFKGNRITDMDFTVLSKKIGVVLQNPEAQIFGMTVEEDMAFGLENLGLSEKEIEEKIDYWLKIFDLTKYRKYNPRFLSGGQKQKLVIASVLAMDPSIIILDEPFINLDQKGKFTLLKILFNYRSSGKIIVLIDKKATEVTRYVDKIIVLSRNGELLSVCTPKEFYDMKNKFRDLGIFPPENSLSKIITV